jgi:hypothetical protein
MEDLFAPTTRFRDLYRAAREHDRREEEMNRLVELELISTGSSVPVEDTFLHCGFSWSDYYSFGHGKIVWLSPDVFLKLWLNPDVLFHSAEIDTNFQTEYRSFLTVRMRRRRIRVSQGSEYLRVYARSEAHATVASGILLQLLTTCDSRKIMLGDF